MSNYNTNYLQNNSLTQQAIQQGVGFQNQLLTNAQNLSLKKPSTNEFFKSFMGTNNNLSVGAMSPLNKGSQQISTGLSQQTPTKGAKLAGSAGMIGGIADSVGSMFKSSADNNVSEGINSAHAVASDTLMSIPTPITQIIGGAMKVQAAGKSALDSLTGGATSLTGEVTTSDKIMDSNLLAFSGISEINALTKKTVKGSNSDLESEINKGYSATDGIDSADFGGITRLFGGRKVRNKMKDRKNRANKIDKENLLKKNAIYSADKEFNASMNSSQDIDSKNRQSLQGGINSRLLAAKKGAKLQFKNIINNIEDKKVVELSKGGKVNVIPDGALHSRKHKLDIDGVTDKGIPVISYEDGGSTEKIEQHAEVEVDEVILHIELTKKLEDLLEQFNKTENKKEKDVLAIEAGKILTEELLENTEDNTGLINTIE